MDEAIASSFLLPKLDDALRRRRVTDARGELAGIIDELFERTVSTREAADALERSAHDVPELAAVFGQVRLGLFERFSTLVRKRSASGHYRQTEPAAMARMIVETVTMFGRHIYNDRQPLGFDLVTARHAIRDALVASLIAA
jgi:hypothetical protein